MSDPASRPNPAEEPLLTVGTLTALGTAALALVAAFGVHLNDDLQAAILAILAVLAPLIVAAIARRKVYSPATVAHKVRLAATAARGRHSE